LVSPGYNLFLLNKFSDKKYVSLSPGQSRKLSLAKIFYSHKPIIILDEPTSNVDPVASNKIFENFAKLKKRQIVIIVTHDILRLNKVANKILMMDQGEVVEFGHTDSLRTDKNSKYSELLRSVQDTIN
jgi:ABC-type multidrug transport system ATPase subunit